MNTNRKRFSQIAAACLTLMSCYPPAQADDEAHVQSTSSALVSSTITSDADRESLGLLNVGGGCSGSLLNNNWVLSAAHCVTADIVRNPSTITLSANWSVVQQQNPDYLYRFWGINEQGGTFDILLLHVPVPFAVNGKSTGYVRKLSPLSLSGINQRSITAYGAGINKFATLVAGVATPSSSDGKYRQADFNVYGGYDQTRYYYPTSPSAQIAGGDSGGPSFEYDATYPRVVGVHSICQYKCLPGKSCPAHDWTWVASVTTCGDAPVGDVAGAIAGILAQTWDPNNPIQPLTIPHSEGQVEKEILLGALDSLPWDYVRRAAQQMCQNRGFIGGYADGGHVAGEHYQIVCVNDTAAQFHDANAAEVGKTGEAFRDLTGITWAKAARVAAGVCRFAFSDAVGGFFTGYQNLSGPGLFVDQHDGLLCFNATSAKFHYATSAELSAAGAAVGNLDAMSWAVAGRAASAYCRKQYYPAGGFLDGSQVGDKRGVICLGRNTGEGAAAATMSEKSQQPASVYRSESPVASIGRGVAPGTAATTPSESVCDSAKEALGRNSPAAPGLEARCAAWKALGVDDLAGRGAKLAEADPLTMELRRQQAMEAARRGFDIGLAAAEGQTALGPGKQKIHDALGADEQGGFEIAVRFSLERNRNADLARKGAAIVEADPGAAQASRASNDVFYWLGFEIASAIFGDPKHGGLGHTATGPGSLGIRNALSAPGQLGFDAAVTFHLSRKY